MSHPLDGVRRLQSPYTPSLQRRIYGTEPVFIFDPNNDCNRPDLGRDKNALLGWSLIPDYVQDLFVRTFTSGMPAEGKTKEQLEVERQSRPSEREWLAVLHQWMNDCSTDGYAH